jgi:hypothetical protein
MANKEGGRGKLRRRKKFFFSLCLIKDSPGNDEQVILMTDQVGVEAKQRPLERIHLSLLQLNHDSVSS